MKRLAWVEEGVHISEKFLSERLFEGHLGGSAS